MASSIELVFISYLSPPPPPDSRGFSQDYLLQSPHPLISPDTIHILPLDHYPCPTIMSNIYSISSSHWDSCPCNLDTCCFASLGLWTVAWLTFTLQPIFIYKQVHTMFVFLGLAFLIQDDSFVIDEKMTESKSRQAQSLGNSPDVQKSDDF